MDYHRNPQKYTDILQEIAIHISTGKTSLFTTAGVLELNTGQNNNRNTSACPAEEAHLTAGTL